MITRQYSRSSCVSTNTIDDIQYYSVKKIYSRSLNSPCIMLVTRQLLLMIQYHRLVLLLILLLLLKVSR